MSENCQFWKEYDKAFQEMGIMISPSPDYCDKFCKNQCEQHKAILREKESATK